MSATNSKLKEDLTWARDYCLKMDAKVKRMAAERSGRPSS
jgi:hypothetical protein